MPDIKEHIAYLSQEIGARPAGTEEEQQAALYITEQFQKEAGLPASIEDFNGVGDAELPTIICCGAAVVLALLSLIIPALSIVGVIGCVVAAGLFAAEALDKPVLSRLLGKGVSQNVVSKYDPGVSPDGEGSRRRKVILVARYDSGKVRTELSSPIAQFLPLINKLSFGAMVALPVLLLIKGVALGSAEGAVPTLFTVLVVLAALLTAVPLVLAVLHKVAPYNEGANCNASGVAALIEVARRIGAGRVSEAEIAEREDALMHGAAAAYENGLVPDGAEFVYASHPRSSMEEEESLVAAKAAIAALSGKPVDGMTKEEVERNLEKIERHDREEAEEEARMQRMEARAIESARREAQEREAQEAREAEQARLQMEAQQAAEQEALQQEAQQADVPVQEGQEGEPVQPAAVPQDEIAEQQAAYAAQQAEYQPRPAANTVPEWFSRAQEKAKKPRNADKPVQRSRYASALDAAVAESAGHFAKANNIVEHELERSFDTGRDTIHEVRAPQWATIKPVQPLSETPVEQPAPQAADHPYTQAVEAKKAAAPATSASETATFAHVTPAAPIDVLVEPAQAVSSQPTAPAEPVTPAPVAPVAQVAPVEAELVQPAPVEQRNPEPSPLIEQTPVQVPEQAPAAPAQNEQPAHFAPEPREVIDPFATAATPPIDVTKLHLDDIPPMRDVPMPSFLDPRKVQKEAQSRQSDAPRSGNRVDVTTAAIADDGRVESPVQSGIAPEIVPEAAQASAADTSGLQATPLDIPSVPATDLPPVTLPEIGNSAPAPAPVAAVAKQRAPLADVESAGKAAARSLLSLLPSIGSSDIKAAHDQEAEEEGSDAKRDLGHSLLAKLPSLSGSIKEADAAQSQPGVNAANSFGTAGATGSFAPVSAELANTMDSDDMYVDDVDDSAYDENFTETGAFAGPGYMEMPKSRFRRLLDRFRHHKDEDEDTPQEWLDVDEQFEARAVGKARGGWESFQEEHYEEGEYQGEYYAESQQEVAYSGATQAMPPLTQNDQLGATQAWEPQPIDVQAVGQQADYQLGQQDFDADDVADDQDDAQGFRKWHGGAYSARRVENGNLSSEELADEAAASAMPEAAEVDAELSDVYQFRNPDITTEVWFVALGAELAQNAGMKAFLEAHQSELRGAFIVDVDALGEGELTMLEREGFLKPAKASSRMKRYIRKASQESGVKVASGSLLIEESAASCAAKRGCQATHLVGMDGALPALYGQQADTVENIDEKKLSANVGFLMELLKNM